MNLLFIMISFLTSEARSQIIMKNYSQLGQWVGKSILSTCLDDEDCTMIPGQALTLAQLPAKECVESSEKEKNNPVVVDSPEKQLEILFVAKLSFANAPQGENEKHFYVFDQINSKALDLLIPSSSLTNWNELKTWSESYKQEQYPNVQRSIFTEGLVYAASKSNLNEKELAQKMANAISHYSSNEDEKMAIFTTLSHRLYKNYNDLRNPLMNTSGTVDTRNIHLNEMISAAADWRITDGGVCSDIAQSLSVLGKELFPDADSLVINNGSHFGVAIVQKGKNPTIINWDIETKNRKQLTFDPAVQVTTTRVYKMDDQGVLRQIANMDTELGSTLKKMYTETSPTLLTGTDPSVAYVQRSEKQKKKNGAHKTINEKVGVAHTSESLMLIFMGESIKIKGANTSSTAVGVSYQNVTANGQQDVVFSFHKTFQRSLIQYVNPRVNLGLTTGAQVDASYTSVLKSTDPTFEGLALLSQSFGTNQRLNFQTTPLNKNNPTFNGSVNLFEILGRGNEGLQTGYTSTNNLSGTLRSLKETNFFINQMDVTGNMMIPLRSNTSATLGANYVGTPVGQKISLDTGIELKAMGAFQQVYLMVGIVNSDLPGFKTKNNLLGTPSGGRAIAGVTLKSGVKGFVKVEGIGTPQIMGNFTLAAPLSRKKKK